MLSQEDQELERRHYISVVKAFQAYEKNMLMRIERYRKDLETLDQHYQALLLPEYGTKLGRIEECSQANQIFLKASVQSHYKVIQEELASISKESNRLNNEREQENIRSLLRQMARDWSDEGREEREATYEPILKMLKDHFDDLNDRRERKVLVPGAGLGRLVYEIAMEGFECQGNEFSLFMLLPSEYILNAGLEPGAHLIYPWIIPFSNQLSLEMQCRSVRVPDIKVTLPKGEMSMTAGDFLEVYSGDIDGEMVETWDALISCFFLDTAKNVLQYLTRFHALLKPGGIWINHGPLLYHFEGSSGEVSIELSLEEVKLMAAKVGFKLVLEEFTQTTYAQDKHSLHQTIYKCHLAKFIRQ